MELSTVNTDRLEKEILKRSPFLTTREAATWSTNRHAMTMMREEIRKSDGKGRARPTSVATRHDLKRSYD
jgi:hypothetical protein